MVIPKTSIPARGLLPRPIRDTRHRARRVDPKDLNPRQGITTPLIIDPRSQMALYPKDLNPRQGITTPQRAVRRSARFLSQRPQSPPGDYYSLDPLDKSLQSDTNPKDLNPRQGITTNQCSYP